MKEDKILQKLEEFSGEFKEIRQTLTDHDEQLAFICEYLGEKVVTRSEYLEGQDQVMTILKRLDEERLSAHERVRQTEDTLEEHGLDIRKMKRRLQMA